MAIKWPCSELAASMKAIGVSTLLVCALLKLCLVVKKKLPRMSANCEKTSHLIFSAKFENLDQFDFFKSTTLCNCYIRN